MKVVEVSAIKEECDNYFGCAVSPCGNRFFVRAYGGWLETATVKGIEWFNRGEGKVHRGIFKIKVVED